MFELRLASPGSNPYDEAHGVAIDLIESGRMVDAIHLQKSLQGFLEADNEELHSEEGGQ